MPCCVSADLTFFSSFPSFLNPGVDPKENTHASKCVMATRVQSAKARVPGATGALIRAATGELGWAFPKTPSESQGLNNRRWELRERWAGLLRAVKGGPNLPTARHRGQMRTVSGQTGDS